MSSIEVGSWVTHPQRTDPGLVVRIIGDRAEVHFFIENDEYGNPCLEDSGETIPLGSLTLVTDPKIIDQCEKDIAAETI